MWGAGSGKPGFPRGTYIQLKGLGPDTLGSEIMHTFLATKSQMLHMNSAGPPLCLCRTWVKATIGEKAESTVILVRKGSQSSESICSFLCPQSGPQFKPLLLAKGPAAAS